MKYGMPSQIFIPYKFLIGSIEYSWNTCRELEVHIYMSVRKQRFDWFCEFLIVKFDCLTYFVILVNKWQHGEEFIRLSAIVF